MKKFLYILISTAILFSCMKESENSKHPGSEITFTIQEAPFVVDTKSSGISDELILCEDDGIILKATYSPMDNVVGANTKVTETTASTLASSGFDVSAVTGSAGSEVSVWGSTSFSGGPTFSGGREWPSEDYGYKFYASNSYLNYDALGTGTYVEFDEEKDIVVAYNNNPTYNSSNTLTFSHISGQVGTITVEEDIAGAGFYIQNVTIEAPGTGNYNIRTGTWSGFDSYTEYDIVSNRYAGTSASNYVFIPGTWDAYVDITVGGKNKQLRFQITIVKGQRINLTLSVAAQYSSSSQELLPGLFSVSSTEKVAFTKGNVQALVNTYTYVWSGKYWKFAENQWDHLFVDVFSDNTWIDMFAWIGTSATDTDWINSYGVVSNDDADGSKYGSLATDVLKSDWSSKFEGGYRIMTSAEWNYLINTRPSASNKRSYGHIRIGGNDINGLIILPDDWTRPNNCSFTPNVTSNYTSNQYCVNTNSGDTNCWYDMEQAGAVFLPAAGTRRPDPDDGMIQEYVNLIGMYATRNAAGSDYDCCTAVQFSLGAAPTMEKPKRNHGLSVRLVKTMQSSSVVYHESVDLGLRDKNGNKVLFATTNVGASSPTDYGDYFAWGETSKRYTSIAGSTVTGATFEESNAPYHTGSDSETGWTKYIPSSETSYWGGDGSPDNILELQRMDDAARVQWGGDWRTPTRDELEWLVYNCTWTWQSDYNGSGVSGFLVTGTGSYSSASAFLPAAGFCYSSTRNCAGEYGFYLSSSVYSDVVPHLNFYGYPEDDDFDWYIDNNYRYIGYSVRPVRTAAP